MSCASHLVIVHALKAHRHALFAVRATFLRIVANVGTLFCIASHQTCRVRGRDSEALELIAWHNHRLHPCARPSGKLLPRELSKADMDANSPIQPPMQPSDGHVPSPTDLTGNVVPKTEDSSFSFPKLSPDGLTSSATHLPGASAPFELVPDGTQAPPTSTMAQMDMAITSLDPLSSNDVFLPAFSSSSQHQRRASLNHHSPSLTHPLKSEDMHGLSALREQSPGSAHTSSSNPSSAASPVPAPPPFSTLSGSSMNSAIERTNDVMLNRSRSGSLASPGMSNGFNPHPQSSPPQPKHDASTNFSSDFAGIPRPDPVNSPHMAVVDDVFCK